MVPHLCPPGVTDDAKPEAPKAIMDLKAQEEAKKRKKEELKMLTQAGETKKEVKEPAPDVFVVSQPYINALDQDIIKLTAQ